MKTHLLFGVAALAALAATVPAQNVKDTIVKYDGSRLRGVAITAAKATAITFQRGDNEDTVAADLVRDILWYDPPSTFGDAEGRLASGDFAGAANLFKEAAGGSERDVFKHDVAYRAGAALLRAAAVDPSRAELAVMALQEYLTAVPDGFRVPAATLGLGRAQRLQGKAAEAEATLTQLEADAVAKSWGFRWDLEAKCERALAQMAQGKYADARSTFRGVLGAVDAALASKGSEADLLALKTRAAVGEGESHIAEKDFDGALQYFRRLGSQSDRGLQSAGLAGEGQVLYLKAAETKDIAGLRQARLALAQANVLDPVGGETTAKALFFTGKVLQALGSESTSSAGGRAEDYFASVERDFADTGWAAQVRAERAK